MSDEPSEKVDRTESKLRNWLGFYVPILSSPLLILVLGFFLNQQMEKQREAFQRLELEVKRIETAQHMLNELFSDIPERAFVADRLMRKLLDENLSKEVSSITALYYRQKLDQRLSNKTLDKAVEIETAAKAIGGSAAESITAQLQTQHYYLVAASIKPDGEKDAIDKAAALRVKKYDGEVYFSTSGYFTVTFGHLPLAEATSLLTKAVKNGDTPEDSYLIPGKTFTKRLYPN